MGPHLARAYKGVPRVPKLPRSAQRRLQLRNADLACFVSEMPRSLRAEAAPRIDRVADTRARIAQCIVAPDCGSQTGFGGRIRAWQPWVSADALRPDLDLPVTKEIKSPSPCLNNGLETQAKGPPGRQR
jgi:hypothetical protein